jgi:UDP-N-acetylglucosamine transferase subunit ALG13
MIFLTVGTQFGFDRLVKVVDNAIADGLIGQPVFAQIGPGVYQPKHMEYVVSLDKDKFDQTLHSSNAMISHAGIGSIVMALNASIPLLVMPRRKKYGEVVNDHQLHTARKFEELGHILVAYDTDELPEKIKLLKTFIPKPRNPNRQGVIDRISQFLEENVLIIGRNERC